MSKRIYIIARYNENLDWVENINGDILIINKGTSLTLPYETIETENYGREAESYIKGIVHLFETDRINNYDEFVFLQGNPTEHSSFLSEKLKFINPAPFTIMSDTWTRHSIPNSDQIFGTNKLIIQLFVNRIHENLNLTEIDIDSLKLKFQCQDGAIVDMGREIEETILFGRILGLPTNLVEWKWSNGAQYLVKKSCIVNKSFEWWKELHKLVMYVAKDLKSDRIAYVFERLWPFIWIHKY